MTRAEINAMMAKTPGHPNPRSVVWETMAALSFAVFIAILALL